MYIQTNFPIFRVASQRAAVYTALPRTAPWRSGYAADCKSVYPGSIPGGASIDALKSLFLLYFL